MKFLPRHQAQRIQSAAQHFKVILLLGARQTGKSILLKHLLPQTKMIVFEQSRTFPTSRWNGDPIPA